MTILTPIIYEERTNTVGGISYDAKFIRNEFKKFYVHYYSLPISRQSIKERFYNLTATWKIGTSTVSSSTIIAMHPAYQEIIGMGKLALPYIFKELRLNPDHWFWALKSITAEDPVKPGDRGNIKKMSKIWLNWAQENGYI